jgi:hypothetical protein
MVNRYIKSANSYGHTLDYFHVDCLWKNAFYMQNQIFYTSSAKGGNKEVCGN